MLAGMGVRERDGGQEGKGEGCGCRGEEGRSPPSDRISKALDPMGVGCGGLRIKDLEGWASFAVGKRLEIGMHP